MKKVSCLLLLFLWIAEVCIAAPPMAKLVEIKKIWDQAPHSAFTDLAYWKGKFACAFREGRGHVSSDGTIRILSSGDGEAWQPAAVVSLEGYDLRDAGLSTTPDGRLMLIGGAAPRAQDAESAPTGTFVSFSDDGTTWSKPHIVLEPGRWLWRVTWRDGTAYGVSYAADSDSKLTALLASDDGVKYRELVPKLLGDGWPTEAVLRFDKDGTAYCLQRRDGKPPLDTAMLGVSKPSYTEWQWHDLDIYFGGPNFIQIPSGQWIAAGRIHRQDGPRTELAWLDVETKTLQPILQLPSGGDTSYPGLVWHEGQLWVSYYSSHEGKASIYLATIRVE